jgi:hypothetical protein
VSVPLEDYALLGDCETAALVARGGSIDWLCWPRFDSDACFAALLGTPEHGRWLVGAVDDAARTSRRYRDDTLILETTIETAGGTVVVTDFMPPRGRYSDIVRVVEGVRGRVRMRTDLVLRFDYGRSVPWVTRCADGRMRAVAGPHMVLLASPAEVHGENFHRRRIRCRRWRAGALVVGRRLHAARAYRGGAATVRACDVRVPRPA